MTKVDSVPERALTFEVAVDAPREAVWDAWTTEDGIASFFAQESTVDLRPGGAYETYFDLDAAPGERGGEGNVVLAVDKPSFLSFTWNAPPSIPETREQRTVVVVRLDALDDDRTRVTLRHLGWGRGPAWEETYDYFERAWGEVVLPNLQSRFVDGPRDWTATEP